MRAEDRKQLIGDARALEPHEVCLIPARHGDNLDIRLRREARTDRRAMRGNHYLEVSRDRRGLDELNESSLKVRVKMNVRLIQQHQFVWLWGARVHQHFN